MMFAARTPIMDDSQEVDDNWITLAGGFEGDIIFADEEQYNQINQVRTWEKIDFHHRLIHQNLFIRRYQLNKKMGIT